MIFLLVAAALATKGSAEAKSSSGQISYVVLFEESQRAHLRAGMMTWMRLVPGTIYLAHEQKQPKGLKGFTYMRVRSTVDYVDICRQAYKSTKSSWVLIMRAHTVVRPRKLSSVLSEMEGHYGGQVRDATEGPPFLGYVPHVAHESGVLLSREALRRVSSIKRREFDFRASEFHSALLAKLLMDKGILPTESWRFASPPVSDSWVTNGGFCLGPLEPEEIFDYGRRIWGAFKVSERKKKYVSVAILVLVRESRAKDSIREFGEGNRSHTNDTFYFVSAEAAPKSIKKVRGVVRLHHLDKQPPLPRFYDGKTFTKGSAWDKWLRQKVARVVDFATDNLFSYDWVLLVDDDSFVDRNRLVDKVLSYVSPSVPLALGRKFYGKGSSLIGGGPGIAISRAALKKIKVANCQESLPIISTAVPGGDGWLGQCLTNAGVPMSDDWHFKSFPPTAYLPRQSQRFATFHRRAMTSRPKKHECRDSVEHWSLSAPVCAPSFTILGAPKAGTTTLHFVLGQHPEVGLPRTKELNFWGSPWLPRNAPDVSVRSFLFDYLAAFPRGKTVVGESSPDYLASIRAVRNLVRFLPSMRLIVSLRHPVDRTASAYYNKKADKSIRRYLDVSTTMLDDEFENPPPSLNDLVLQVNETLTRCPQHHKHYTMHEVGSCYINPFVKHSAYASYLEPWLVTYPKVKVVDFDNVRDDTKSVVDDIAKFLDLNASFTFDTDLLYNTRLNRGVLTRQPKKTGGLVSAIRRQSVVIEPWALRDVTRDILTRYFETPNDQLAVLLDKYHHPRPNWLIEF